VSAAKSKKAVPVTPTRDWLRTVSILLCLVGIVTAGYLSWAEAAGKETVCVNKGGINCTVVQQSAYSKTLGFPDAWMGLLGFIAILGVLMLEDQVEFLAAYGRTLVVGMTLFGTMFQTYLAYVEATVLEKWCQWCILSHITITLILLVGVYRLYAFMKPLRH
jgi:uncharacterized membrane protein